jgi:hypothetical protein
MAEAKRKEIKKIFIKLKLSEAEARVVKTCCERLRDTNGMREAVSIIQALGGAQVKEYKSYGEVTIMECL